MFSYHLSSYDLFACSEDLKHGNRRAGNQQDCRDAAVTSKGERLHGAICYQSSEVFVHVGYHQRTIMSSRENLNFPHAGHITAAASHPGPWVLWCIHAEQMYEIAVGHLVIHFTLPDFIVITRLPNAR